MTGRVLAIDPGERRVGLAVSDPLGITAQGLDTFDRRGGDLIAHIEVIAREYEITLIVVGNPVSMSGRESEGSALARALAGALHARLSLPVELWDERLSSAEAHRVLKGSRVDKGTVDRVAAVIILQGYLDAHSSRGDHGDERDE
ncbi:MAG TPA: Holliday junction resolvase RuvX [Candidatus Krumholzibacteria bacterium]|nr:Holliday junction resolvase RuvX [Candidatus Krumholzibacteria bacterium]